MGYSSDPIFTTGLWHRSANGDRRQGAVERVGHDADHVKLAACDGGVGLNGGVSPDHRPDFGRLVGQPGQGSVQPVGVNHRSRQDLTRRLGHDVGRAFGGLGHRQVGRHKPVENDPLFFKIAAFF
jgi:hypothetical protein